MPVECVSTNLESDIRCAVCGQGFLLFCQRITKHERATLRARVQQALRGHHHAACDDHPRARFLVEFAADIPIPALA